MGKHTTVGFAFMFQQNLSQLDLQCKCIRSFNLNLVKPSNLLMSSIIAIVCSQSSRSNDCSELIASGR
jgi:hypothetical protein